MMERIPQEWFGRAKNESDPYFKFMSIYVALNFLYNNLDIQSERCRMKTFLKEEAERYNYRFNLSGESEFFKHPVQDMKTTKTYPVENNNLNSLFDAIYTIRCNLFHGNKMLGNVRDKALVGESANILIEVLRSRLEIDSNQ